MALAAFLPALVYSYAKELMDELEQSFKEYQKDVNDRLKTSSAESGITPKDSIECKKHKFHTIRKDIPGFIYTIDLILTQSMILVAFSGLVGVTIYLCCINTQYWYKASFIIPALTLLYFVGLIISLLKIVSLKDQFNKHWNGWKCYTTLWGIATGILCVIIGEHSWKFYSLLRDNPSLCAQQLKELFFREGHIPLHWIVSSLTLALIIASISWLLPLIHYTPLMGRLDLVLKDITNHEKITTPASKKEEGG